MARMFRGVILYANECNILQIANPRFLISQVWGNSFDVFGLSTLLLKSFLRMPWNKAIFVSVLPLVSDISSDNSLLTKTGGGPGNPSRPGLTSVHYQLITTTRRHVCSLRVLAILAVTSLMRLLRV